MKVRLLGTAAGGGFPQWNCNCAVCQTARREPSRAHPRSQSCVAISADNCRWFLLNASPDLRQQIESFLPLQPHPDSIRGTAIDGIILTNADFDHTLGLHLIREGRRIHVHATPQVKVALDDGLNLSKALENYCGLTWHVPPSDMQSLPCADGQSSGLSYSAFDIPGKVPRYMRGSDSGLQGHSVGYRIRDDRTGTVLAFAPDVSVITPAVRAVLAEADAVLFDGTFWSDNEMHLSGTGEASAASMGHLPISGALGSLAQLSDLKSKKNVFIHINNTNPILLEDSPERAQVLAAGWTVGSDGDEFEI